jgi:hypothetical protein
MSFTELAYYIAPFIGVTTLVIGICAVIRPLPMAAKFGISVGEPALPYVVSTGIRDVFIGLAVLILFYLQEWKALGAINLCIAIVAISDFMIVRKYGNKKTSYVHLAGAIAVITYGVWLL